MTSTTTGRISPVQALGLALAGVLLVGGYVVEIAAIPDERIRLVLAVFIATVILWITKPVPYEVSSVLCVILLYGLGLADTFTDAVIGFASTLIFFFLLLLLIGMSISKVDLDQWMASRLVSATSTPRSSIRRLTGTVLFLAFVMPSGLARTVTFIPVIDQINDLYNLGEDSMFSRLSYYMVGHLNPIASVTVMTGGGMAVVTAELINAMVRPITWVEWVVYMGPPVIVLFITSMIIASRFYPVADRGTIDDTDVAATTNHDGEIEPLSRDQQIVISVLFLAIIAWVIGSFVGVPAIIPAMGAVFILALPTVEIITADEFKSLSWGIIFLIATMLSILEVMQDLAAFEFIIEATLSGFNVEQLGVLMLVVLLVFCVAVRATFSSPAASMAILLPIVLEFSGVLGYNELFLSFSLMVVMVSATFMPINLATVLVAYEAGPLTLREVFLLGILTLLVAITIVAGSWLLYWPFVDLFLAGIF